jgi:aspartate carbamoyltransferase catalytic subunit
MQNMKQHLLGLRELPTERIIDILNHAAEMKQILASNIRKPLLHGKTIATLFYENSTRTRNSFETAAKILGAGVISISTATSSVNKGETLIDTGRNLDALLTDIIIIRHSMSGAAVLLARNVRSSVVNAGDGACEHPTQALLDIFTMREHFGNNLKGLKVVMCGDIKFSRVARSNIWGLSKLGVNITVVAPLTLVPAGIEAMGCKVQTNVDKAVEGANVIMGLRIQNERQAGGMIPSIAEYAHFYCINSSHLKKAASNVIVMHPGPVNRGVELASEVVDGAASVILEQVSNGVAVRMAVLDMLANS